MWHIRVTCAGPVVTPNATCAAALGGLFPAWRARPKSGGCCAHASRATSSVDAFVEQLSADGTTALHILINNAGVLIPPFGKVCAGCRAPSVTRIRPHAGFVPLLTWHRPFL